MEKRGLKYLNEFSYIRSFNRYVLLGDTEMQEAYKKGQEIGTISFRRSKIILVGDHAAGKTSTCRRLQGKEFRNDEPSTIGIETKNVEAKVSNVNSKWREVKNSPIEDYVSSAAWWAVSHVLKSSNNAQVPNSNENTDLTYVPIQKLLGDIWYQMLYSIPIMILFFLGGFTFGFGLVSWIQIISLMTIVDVHSAYRFGCGYAIAMTLIDSIGSHLWTDIYSIIILVCMYGCISLITGVIVGAGGRTGICLAYCIMVHPQQKLFTFENVTEHLMIIYHQALSKIIICILASIVIVVFKDLHVKILSMSRKSCIFTLIIMTICFWAVVFFGKQYFVGIFTLLFIVVTVFFIISGILLGRKCVAYGYVPQIYIFKKSVGFIAGIIIAIFCGWEFQNWNLENGEYTSITRQFFNITGYLTPIIFFIFYEAFVFIKVKKTKAIPLTHIRESIKANARMESYLDVRLSLWDFAGQEIYYNTHHLFMPRQGVYLVLFNVVEAVTNPGKQIKRLQFWLQSIAMHAEIEEAVVFLVGTRRTQVKDTSALSYFDKMIKFHLYRRFLKLLAFHPSGSLCFFIENALQFDNELNILREVIYSEVNKFKFFKEKFQLKCLLFKDVLNKFCQEKCLITELQTITDEVNSKRNQITSSQLMTVNEVREILKLFDKSGDIVYKERDELLRNYVICNPQFLIDIVTMLVNVPEPHQRNRIVADFWQMLQDTGIVDSRLLEHICEGQGIWRLYPCVIRFLVGTHLIFPLNVTNQVDQIGTFCLPCRLPKIDVTKIWNVHSQDVYYFDFGEMLPEFIFLRLMAKCCEIFTWDEVYYNAARFRVSSSNSNILFLINTQVIPGSLNSYDRNLIKVSVENDDHAQSIKILQQLINCTCEISKRLFNPEYFHEQYICGLECKTCNYLDGGALCLVNIIAHGNDVSTLEAYKPDQYHKVTLKTKRYLTCNRVTSHWV